MQTSEAMQDEWARVCRVDDILPNTGVCCLLGREQVAVFRLADGRCYAIGNFDPFGRANVLSRGIVGDRAGRVKVASPLYKQSFCLDTGVCLDEPSVSVPAYDVRLTGGYVELRRRVVRVPRSGTVTLVADAQTT